MPSITLLPENRILHAPAGMTLHALLAREGLVDAPCGGQGTCGKCTVTLEGRQVPACRTVIDRDMTLTLPSVQTAPSAALSGTRIAFDIGTTTLVCSLVDGQGRCISQAACRNPQTAWGADVVSRLRAAASGLGRQLTEAVRTAMNDLLLQVCNTPQAVQIISVVGNPAMQQLFLGLPVDNLVQLPFGPVLKSSQISPCGDLFPHCPEARLLTVPDISGFVGADTVAGILACGLHEQEALTLLVDIGTNGEMVLGNRHRLMACSTAAGPALEGAGITVGMRAEAGAIDRVRAQNGAFHCHFPGNGQAVGICGSGIVDAVAAAMDLGLVNRRGRILNEERKIMLTKTVCLTQEDIRQVQLAKGAMAAGIRLLAKTMGVPLEKIQRVVLAGAFGSHMDPESACRIGLLPQELRGKITAGGNTAGTGAALLAAHPQRLALADEIVKKTEYLELSQLEDFPKTFARSMELPENWCITAEKIGFSHAVPLDPACLQVRQEVRAMCAQDKCRAYGKNWTCPPHCGTLDLCQSRMSGYKRGILVQTVGRLAKDIDSRGYQMTEQRHLENFRQLCQALRRQYPQALCLGSGGCRICGTCAWPEPCRFPEQAVSSMEGYGLFVTQVCRDAGLAYHHGERTVTYTACILY